MYKITAAGALIYDSMLDDYHIGAGAVSLEADAAGSFNFSIFPEHPYYDKIKKLKTVIVVYKSGRIVFRGRALTDDVNYWNEKAITCEGELSFLNDSVVRPYNFSGTPEELFRWFIEQHNAQVDEFKRFKVGTCTVIDPNGYIARENTGYENTLANMTSRLREDATGGHFCITHGDDGTDPVPTIHYLADYTRVASQAIEFGVNLTAFDEQRNAEDLATAIIPLGATVDDGNSDTDDPKLTIASVNGGKDYVSHAQGVQEYGWIFRVVEWDDVTDAATLKAKAEAYLDSLIRPTLTLELSAVDLHLLDRSIESYSLCEYIPVISTPHNFRDVLLCTRQTFDLLNPANDSVTLGATVADFTAISAKNAANVSSIQKWSGRLSKALAAGAQNTAGLADLSARLDALYAAGYITITVTVAGATEELLTSLGVLTVNGQRITAEISKIAVMAGDISVVFTPAADLETAQTVTANTVALGTVSTMGQSISATLEDVTDGGTVAVVFTS